MSQLIFRNELIGVSRKAHCQVICPEWNRIYLVKIEENVPIFADKVVYANLEKVIALSAPPAADASEAAPSPAANAPGAVEPPAPATPPAPAPEDEQVVPPPPPPHPSQLDSVIERKRREATSAEHRITPKNPFASGAKEAE